MMQWNVVRDNAGRIVSKTENIGGETHNYAYDYDAVGRLRSVTLDGDVVESYNYDLSGTRISEINRLRGINNGRRFSYSDEDHLLTAGDATYSYDPDGFLTSKTKADETTTYDYSVRGELLKVQLPDKRIISYDHDPLGRRIAKRIDGVMVEKYLWQGLTKLLAVYDGADNLKQRFEYADDRLPVSMTTEGVRYFLAYDQVGSLRLVVDGSGNVVKRIDYDAFGNIVNDSNPAMRIPFGFAGGLHDRDIGLVRFGYRDYDPDTGRWTAKDPIGFAGGDTDLFGYCFNNPINFVDQNGLIIGRAIAEIVGRIGGRTAGERAVAGMMADGTVALALETSGISPNIPGTLGYITDGLQMQGGSRLIVLGNVIAVQGTVSPFIPAVLSGGGGVLVGLGFNHIYERISGQPLGADIYDWEQAIRGWLNNWTYDDPCR